MDLFRLEGIRVEHRMLAALDHHQRVSRRILCRHVPGASVAVPVAADAEPLALADGVEHQAVVAAELAPVGADYRSGIPRDVVLEKRLERPLADKADAGAVLARVIVKLELPGQRPYLRLGQRAHGKKCMGELALVEQAEKVALILLLIPALKQAIASVLAIDARIVTGGDHIRA